MRYIFISIFIVLISSLLYADTVIMKDGMRNKGLVVDEYVDRVVLSTVDGEKIIFKNDIEKIEYNTPEQNFMQIGRSYYDKGLYDKASFYYKRVLEINPDYKEARDAYLASHAKMWHKEEYMVKKEMHHRSMVMDWWKKRKDSSDGKVTDKALLLKEILGISLLEKDGIWTIDEVLKYSNADKSGIKEGDIIVSIGSRLIRYSRLKDVINELIEGDMYSEIKIQVERDIHIPVDRAGKDLYKELGILLGFEYEGLVVKSVASGKKGEKAGLKKSDFVLSINNNITRYLPLDSIIAIIDGHRDNKEIIFTIKRDITLVRGEGGQ